jgi:hypothetical protein
LFYSLNGIEKYKDIIRKKGDRGMCEEKITIYYGNQEVMEYKQKLINKRDNIRKKFVNDFLNEMYIYDIDLEEIEKLIVEDKLTLRIVKNGEKKSYKLPDKELSKILSEGSKYLESIGLKITYKEKNERRKGLIFNKDVKIEIWEIDCSNIVIGGAK